jgi:hypothetical protein
MILRYAVEDKGHLGAMHLGRRFVGDAREHDNDWLPACLTEGMHLLHLEYLKEVHHGKSICSH